jgi:hypothetical protein
MLFENDYHLKTRHDAKKVTIQLVLCYCFLKVLKEIGLHFSFITKNRTPQFARQETQSYPF